MKKRIISLLAALLLVCALVPAAGAVEYTDVPAGHWAADDIARATELGLFKGVGNGKFGLGQPITRAEFATALVRFFDWTAVPADRGSFTDVPAKKWYAKWVETALYHEAVPASSNVFRPEDPITRAELVEMLIRGMGYANLAGQVDTAYRSPFTDVTGQTAKKGFIIMASDMGIVGGVGKERFQPNGTATREVAAAILVRAYDLWYSQSKEAVRTTGYTRITVPSLAEAPRPNMPVTPLEPQVQLYDTLRTLRRNGQDMSKTILCLSAGGIETVVSNGAIISTRPLTALEVAALVNSGVPTYYSESHECAYLIYQPNEYQVATVWYQSPESLEAKLQLARLFGVTQYFLLV